MFIAAEPKPPAAALPGVITWDARPREAACGEPFKDLIGGMTLFPLLIGEGGPPLTVFEEMVVIKLDERECNKTGAEDDSLMLLVSRKGWLAEVGDVMSIEDVGTSISTF